VIRDERDDRERTHYDRVRTNLSRFEAPGGILTSTQVTGSQWDAPFGWAPRQMIAVEGLRRYGYDEDADRVATKFLALVTKEFQECGVSRVTGGPATAGGSRALIGFGPWALGLRPGRRALEL